MKQQRVNKHQDACKRGDEKTSAIAEHARQQHHPIKWEDVRVVDRAIKNHELIIKKLYTYRCYQKKITIHYR